MSHHGVHLFPGVVPLEKPQKADKKRRLRKLRGHAVAPGREIDGISELDELFVLEEYPDEIMPDEATDPAYGGRSALNWFSGTTMKALLQAQENK